jgi:gliding motility-associated-like protein/uncharacterized repeat protein (TIGR01451 family)
VSSIGSHFTSINVSLSVNQKPVVNSASMGSICSGVPQSYNITSTVAGSTYSWSRAAVAGISNTAVSGQTGNPVTETLTNTTAAPVIGNTFNYTVTVTPEPVAIANSNSPVCAGSSINLTAQTVSGGTYLWTGPDGYSSSAQNPVIISAAANAGTYTLIVTVNGCASAPADITVIVNNCVADLSVVKTVDNAHPLIGHTVTFTITVTNNGPYDATGVKVTEILQSGYAYVSSTTTTGTYDHLTGIWTIGNLNNGASEILTVTVTVIAAGNYVNTATITGNQPDLNSMNDISVIEAFPTDFNIPEGFSPNGDGINDEFVIRGIDNYPDNTFVIFNRWGDKVFEASPYQNTWTGNSTRGLRVGGDELPVGTYFYLLDLKDGSKIIKGTIYLSR